MLGSKKICPKFGRVIIKVNVSQIWGRHWVRIELVKENSMHTLFMYIMFYVLKKTISTNKVNKCICYNSMNES